jgi:hypothetical protein
MDQGCLRTIGSNRKFKKKKHNKDIHNLHSILNFIRWIGHVEFMQVIKNAYTAVQKYISVSDYLGVDQMIILKLILKNYGDGD